MIFQYLENMGQIHIGFPRIFLIKLYNLFSSLQCRSFTKASLLRVSWPLAMNHIPFFLFYMHSLIHIHFVLFVRSLNIYSFCFHTHSSNCDSWVMYITLMIYIYKRFLCLCFFFFFSRRIKWRLLTESETKCCSTFDRICNEIFFSYKIFV
jgi:hypothetical protein